MAKDVLFSSSGSHLLMRELSGFHGCKGSAPDWVKADYPRGYGWSMAQPISQTIPKWFVVLSLEHTNYHKPMNSEILRWFLTVDSSIHFWMADSFHCSGPGWWFLRVSHVAFVVIQVGYNIPMERGPTIHLHQNWMMVKFTRTSKNDSDNYISDKQ
jgi:hypothetical protein